MIGVCHNLISFGKPYCSRGVVGGITTKQSGHHTLMAHTKCALVLTETFIIKCQSSLQQFLIFSGALTMTVAGPRALTS